MRYQLKATHGRRKRTVDFHSTGDEWAKAEALHLLNYLWTIKGVTGDVWKAGDLVLLKDDGSRIEIDVAEMFE